MLEGMAERCVRCCHGESQVTQLEAIKRIERQRQHLQKRIAERTTEGLPFHHQEWDIEACDLAIAALRYVHEVQEYEQSQQI
jgi:hypothetical protein